MANIKSAKKRILVSEKKRMQNQMLVSKLKTVIKKYNAAITAKDLALAEKLLPDTFACIDSVASKGAIHRNNAARKKAVCGKKLDELKAWVAANPAPKAEEAPAAPAAPTEEEAPKKRRTKKAAAEA